MMTRSSIISSGLITVNQWFEHSQNTALGNVESLRRSALEQRMALLLEWDWQRGAEESLLPLAALWDGQGLVCTFCLGAPPVFLV